VKTFWTFIFLFFGIVVLFVNVVNGNLNNFLVKHRIGNTPRILLFVSDLQDMCFSYKGAVKTLKLLYEKYPDTEYADNALFKMATIYYDDLDDRNSAIKSLQDLLYYYPESEYRKEAEEKLDIYIKGPKW